MSGIAKMKSPSKRKAPKEKDETFVLARRSRLSRSNKPASFTPCHALPDELLLKVFSSLDLIDLLRTSSVCKRWYQLSSDESLWYSLDLCGKPLSDGVLGRLLPYGVVVFRCPRTSIGEPMFTDMRSLRLQHVDLSNCTISTESLQSILARCYTLQNLALEGLELSDDIMRSIAQNLNLIRLNLGGCSKFSPDGLTDVLKNCTKLKELNLSWCSFTADHVATATCNLPSSLTELNLSGYRQNVDEEDVEMLVERCPNLISLDLSDSVTLTPDCLPVLGQLQHLQELGLSRCYLMTPTPLILYGRNRPLKVLSMFGISHGSTLDLLNECLPQIKINCTIFSTIARPTPALSKQSREIWGIKCKLTLQPTDAVVPDTPLPSNV